MKFSRRLLIFSVGILCLLISAGTWWVFLSEKMDTVMSEQLTLGLALEVVVVAAFFVGGVRYMILAITYKKGKRKS